MKKLYWRFLNKLFSFARYLKKDYDPNEDYYCCNCSKPVFRRVLFCSELCSLKYNIFTASNIQASVKTKSGREVFLEDNALAEMLVQGVIFPVEIETTENGETFSAIKLVVMANDVFGYACADYETLPYDSIKELYDLWKGSSYGAIRWLCLRTGLKPIQPIIDSMKMCGEWDNTLDNLRE